MMAAMAMAAMECATATAMEGATAMDGATATVMDSYAPLAVFVFDFDASIAAPLVKARTKGGGRSRQQP
jgi:hypothetical protein